MKLYVVLGKLKRLSDSLCPCFYPNTIGAAMKGIFKKAIFGLAAAISLVLCLASPSLAATQGNYGGSVSSLYGTQLITGQHSSSYTKATVSVNSGCAGGGYFHLEQQGGGRCSTYASVNPRITANMTYTYSFSGNTQLYATALNTAAGSYYISGYYRFNVN